MNVLQQYGKEIVAVLVPLITWILNSFFKAKARLVWASPHQFTFIVQPQPVEPGGQIAPAQNVRTQSIFLWNAGRATATKVELVFNWKPMCFNIWPPRKFDEHVQPDGRFTLLFESLAPNEVVGCEMLAAAAEIPAVLALRCDECVGELMAMAPRPVLSPGRRRVIMFLSFAGLAAVVYVVILLLQFLIVKTPFGL